MGGLYSKELTYSQEIRLLWRLSYVKNNLRRRITLSDLAGKGPFAFAISVIIFLVSYFVDTLLLLKAFKGWEDIQIVLSIILLGLTLIVFVYALRHLTFRKHNKVFVKSGPYAYVRHPRYSALVFLAYPAAALLVHSFTSLASTLLVYFIFKVASLKEEANLIKLFGDEYLDYKRKTPAFIPKLKLIKSELR